MSYEESLILNKIELLRDEYKLFVSECACYNEDTINSFETVITDLNEILREFGM